MNIHQKDMSDANFINDIEIATEIFKNKLGYNPEIFSYPFGEYSLYMKQYIKDNFKIAFGQHSGVIDVNKEKFQLPRFPINEKYGEIKRFKSLIEYKPLEYKSLKPEQKKIDAMKATNEALNAGIEATKPGNTANDVAQKFWKILDKYNILITIEKSRHIYYKSTNY